MTNILESCDSKGGKRGDGSLSTVKSKKMNTEKKPNNEVTQDCFYYGKKEKKKKKQKTMQRK